MAERWQPFLKASTCLFPIEGFVMKLIERQQVTAPDMHVTAPDIHVT